MDLTLALMADSKTIKILISRNFASLFELMQKLLHLKGGYNTQVRLLRNEIEQIMEQDETRMDEDGND